MFLSKNIEEQADFIEDLMFFDYNNEIKRFLIDICKENDLIANNGLYFKFSCRLNADYIKMFSDNYLVLNKYIEKDIKSIYINTKKEMTQKIIEWSKDVE